MPLPTRGDVHVDQALTNISVAYIQQARNFVSSTVFPPVPVDKQSDKYFIYTKGDFRRNEVKPRAPGTESAGGGFRLSTDSYAAEVYAYHKDIPDQIRSNADAAINVENDASRFVTELMMIQREVQWASDYFTTGVWDTDVVGSTNFDYWDDSSSDPESDVDTARATILQNTGYEPNTLVVGFQVHQALKKHPLITERFKYTSSDSITDDMLARYFEVDRYIVSRASYVTSEEGAATDTSAFIAGKNALFCYVAPNPGILIPSAGYTFVWSGLTGASTVGVKIANFRVDLLESDRVEGSFAYDNKVVSSDLGYFFSAAVS